MFTTSSAHPEARDAIRVCIDGAAPLSLALIAQLENACDEVENAGFGSMLALSLLGKHSDADVPTWPGFISIREFRKWEQAIRRLETLNAPTVATCSLVCGTGALEILVAVDYRIASTDLKIRLGGTSMGLFPSTMLYRLARQIGPSNSRRLALFGGDVTALQAADWGLVNEVDTDADSSLARFAKKSATTPKVDVAKLRRLHLEGLTMTYEDALGMHLAACDRALRQGQPEK